MPETLTLGGRTFAPIGEATTAEHDAWMMTQLRDAGLLEALRAQATDRDTATFDPLVVSGRMFEVMAGALLEPGRDWTPAWALETAAHLRRLTDPEDKARLFAEMGALLRGFFGRAPGSSADTGSSSGAPDGDAGAPEGTAPTTGAPTTGVSGPNAFVSVLGSPATVTA